MKEGDLAVLQKTEPGRNQKYQQRFVHTIKAMGICDGHWAVCLLHFNGEKIDIYHLRDVRVITADQVVGDPPQEQA